VHPGGAGAFSACYSTFEEEQNGQHGQCLLLEHRNKLVDERTRLSAHARRGKNAAQRRPQLPLVARLYTILAPEELW
jgi:hypothetical protein